MNPEDYFDSLKIWAWGREQHNSCLKLFSPYKGDLDVHEVKFHWRGRILLGHIIGNDPPDDDDDTYRVYLVGPNGYFSCHVPVFDIIDMTLVHEGSWKGWKGAA